MLLFLLLFSAQCLANEPYIRTRHEVNRSYYERAALSRDVVDDYTDTVPSFVDTNVKLVSDAQEGLLAKVLMIRQAKHTIDLSTYIFTKDESGYTILNELRKAIERGVSVRILIDSSGSLDSDHCELKVLKQVKAGLQKDKQGRETSKPATVEIRMFNPVFYPTGDAKNLYRTAVNYFKDKDDPYLKGWVNRRMHDKLLMTDASYGSHARALLGGRNISNDYYGIPRVTPDTYNDMEILFTALQSDNIGWTSPAFWKVDDHYNRMFYHLGNKELNAPYGPTNWYCKGELETAENTNRKVLHSNTQVGEKLLKMADSDYFHSGMETAKANFLDEIHNLGRRNAFVNPEPATNPMNRPNGASIISNMKRLISEAKNSIEIVSPYIYFYPEEIEALKNWLREDSNRTLTIVSNSLYSADNVLAQALIDREIGPALITAFNTPELRKRAKFLAYGKLDGTLFGGDKQYGKMHAKFGVIDGNVSLVTTSNGDPRSRYLNSEIGLLVRGRQTAESLQKEIKRLSDASVEWGSNEWRQIRDRPELKYKMSLQKKAYPVIKTLGLRPLI